MVEKCVFGFVNQFSRKVVYVRSNTVADCDTDHCVVTAKGRERLSVSKQTQILYAVMCCQEPKQCGNLKKGSMPICHTFLQNYIQNRSLCSYCILVTHKQLVTDVGIF